MRFTRSTVSPRGMLTGKNQLSSAWVPVKACSDVGHYETRDREALAVMREVSKPSDPSVSAAAEGALGLEVDPGLGRAGAAAAARRRELNISQRSLAADGIINAGALIAFEKGRSWPREKTRARLEEILRWPQGTIARIRESGLTPGEIARDEPAPDDQTPLIAQAVIAAADSCARAIEALPSAEDPGFARTVAPILADLRRVEAVAIRATQLGTASLPLIKALSSIRHRYHELMMLSAKAPEATLGQRLYAARTAANLSVAETAQAGGVAHDVVLSLEAEEQASDAAVESIEALIIQISWL